MRTNFFYSLLCLWAFTTQPPAHAARVKIDCARPFAAIAPFEKKITAALDNVEMSSQARQAKLRGLLAGAVRQAKTPEELSATFHSIAALSEDPDLTAALGTLDLLENFRGGRVDLSPIKTFLAAQPVPSPWAPTLAALEILQNPSASAAEIERLLQYRGLLTDDLQFEHLQINRSLIGSLGGLPASAKAEASARLSRHRLLFEKDAKNLTGHHAQNEAKAPKRNQQFLQIVLSRDEWLGITERLNTAAKAHAPQKEILAPLEEFLARQSPVSPAYSLSRVIAAARLLQKDLRGVLGPKGEVEIFGSFPNLQATPGKSDIDLFFSDELDSQYRAIKGGMMGNETYVSSAKNKHPLALALSAAEREIAPLLSPQVKPGELFGVSVRPTTVSRGQIFVEESREEMMAGFGAVSPVTVVVSKNKVRLRIYDSLAEPRGNYTDIPLE